jgi:hypothetical protein
MRRKEELERIEDFVLHIREFSALVSFRIGAIFEVFAHFAPQTVKLRGTSGKSNQSTNVQCPTSQLHIHSCITRMIAALQWRCALTNCE